MTCSKWCVRINTLVALGVFSSLQQGVKARIFFFFNVLMCVFGDYHLSSWEHTHPLMCLPHLTESAEAIAMSLVNWYQPSIKSCLCPGWLIWVFGPGTSVAAGKFHVKLIYSEAVMVMMMLMMHDFLSPDEGLDWIYQYINETKGTISRNVGWIHKPRITAAMCHPLQMYVWVCGWVCIDTGLFNLFTLRQCKLKCCSSPNLSPMTTTTNSFIIIIVICNCRCLEIFSLSLMHTHSHSHPILEAELRYCVCPHTRARVESLTSPFPLCP